jgi:dTDP-glucose pyrophosphorylase
MAGKALYFSESDYPFPKPLIEIGPLTVIEHVLQNLSAAADQVQFIFVLNQSDCRKFHIDATLNILTNHTCKIVRLDNDTRGAACSALMAIDHIDNDQPLLIANADQVFHEPLAQLLAPLQQADAGVVTFESVHPRWSYVRLNAAQEVVETAEKRPISRHAVAGLYYFRQGQDFVACAMRSIAKDSHVNGSYYIAPTLNEMILKGKRIVTSPVARENYHTFYTPQKIKEYEALLRQGAALR